MLFTYNKNGNGKNVYFELLLVPYFYFLGLDIKKINLDQIKDNYNIFYINEIISDIEENAIQSILIDKGVNIIRRKIELNNLNYLNL